MSLQSRIEALKSRHASLDGRIIEEDHRPRPDFATLAKLKLEKLRLKEELERLQTSGSDSGHGTANLGGAFSPA